MAKDNAAVSQGRSRIGTEHMETGDLSVVARGVRREGERDAEIRTSQLTKMLLYISSVRSM